MKKSEIAVTANSYTLCWEFPCCKKYQRKHRKKQKILTGVLWDVIYILEHTLSWDPGPGKNQIPYLSSQKLVMPSKWDNRKNKKKYRQLLATYEALHKYYLWLCSHGKSFFYFGFMSLSLRCSYTGVHPSEKQQVKRALSLPLYL